MNVSVLFSIILLFIMSACVEVMTGLRLTVLDNGALRLKGAQPSDTGQYTCLPPRSQQQLHIVVVVFMPTVSVDYQFVYRVPMCDEMRMSQKVIGSFQLSIA